MFDPTAFPANSNHIFITTMVWRDKYYRTFTSQMLYRGQALTGLPTHEEMQNYANSFFDTLAGEIDDITDHEAFFNSVEMRFLNNESVDLYVMSNHDPVSGDLGDIVEDPDAETESNPPYVALCFRKITNKAGRNKRGRMFIPCISERILHDGILDLLNYPAVKNVITAFMAPADFAFGANSTPLIPTLYDKKEHKFEDIKMMACNQFAVTRRDRRWKERPLLISP